MYLHAYHTFLRFYLALKKKWNWFHATGINLRNLMWNKADTKEQILQFLLHGVPGMGKSIEAEKWLLGNGQRWKVTI